MRGLKKTGTLSLKIVSVSVIILACNLGAKALGVHCVHFELFVLQSQPLPISGL